MLLHHVWLCFPPVGYNMGNVLQVHLKAALYSPMCQINYNILPWKEVSVMSYPMK